MMWEQARVFAIVGALRFLLASGRLDPDSREARQQLRFSTAIVGQAEGHLATNRFFVADRYTVADIALSGYLQVAHEAGVDMDAFPNVVAWLECVREQPNHVADLEVPPVSHLIGAPTGEDSPARTLLLLALSESRRGRPQHRCAGTPRQLRKAPATSRVAGSAPSG